MLRRLRRARLRTKLADRFLLSPDQFDRAALCERMRVDRNHSTVSLLVIRLPRERSSARDVVFLARLLEGRLRLTDTAGWLRDGRIGVLLPDTPEAGAWKVASDLCEAYEVGPLRPHCEVLIYPERRHGGGESSTDDAARGTGIALPGSAAIVGDPSPTAGATSNTGAQAMATVTLAGDRATWRRSIPVHRAPHANLDAILARPLPLWKRSLDVVGASVGLAAVSPVLLLAMAAIKLTSPGDALFSQEREGLGGRRFRIWKLRTMRPDAEALKEGLRPLSEQDGPAFKLQHDPRVTPVGRFLRRTSLDELPQLWNVLRGEMSLVGPRPLPVDESQKCRPWQRRRLHVTPGLTCFWQIRGRNTVSFDEWIRMDLTYVERQSPWCDLRLLAETAPALLLAKGR